MSVREFIEQNRGTGSTTWLAEATIASGGFLIVANYRMAGEILKAFPQLRKEQVISYSAMRNGNVPRGFARGTVFVDPSVLATNYP